MSKHPWVAVHAIFAALLLACFSPVWVGGQLLAPMDILDQLLLPWRGDTVVPDIHNHFVSDAITQYIPYRWFAHQSIRTDGYVGWNDLNYCGTPQYANTMTTSFDWTIQLHRWMDFWDAWHLGLFLQFWIAGAGMMIFLRSQGISPTVGLLGAICYAGNFQFVAWIYHRWALGSFSWMPLLLWSVVPLTRLDWRSSRWLGSISGKTLLAPVFLFLAFCGGTLQHSAFVVIAVGCIALATLVELRQTPRLWPRPLAVFSGLGLVGVGLAWFMFEPTIEAFRVTQSVTARAQPFGYSGGPLQPLLNALVYPLFAFPWPMGSPNTLDIWKYFKTDLFYLPYIGFLPAILAVAGLFSQRVPVAAKLLIAAGFLLPLTPLVAPLYHRVFLVGIIGAVWTACAYLNGVDSDEVAWSKWIYRLFFALTAVWILGSIGLLIFRPMLSARLGEIIKSSVTPENFSVFPEWFLSRGERFLDGSSIWSSGAFTPWLLACAGVISLSLFANRRILHRTLVSTVICLAAFELVLMATRWVSFSPQDSSPVAKGTSGDLYPPTDMVLKLRSLGGTIRLYTDPSSLYRLPFPPNTLSTFGLSTLRGYDSITDGLMPGVGAPTEPSKALTEIGVTHALVQKPLTGPRWTPIAHADNLYLYEFAEAQPRYSLPDGTPAKLSGETSNKRAIEFPDGVSTVRVSENWHQGWHVQSPSGEKTPAIANDDLSITVANHEQGDRIVNLVFTPHPSASARTISLIACMTLIWLWTLKLLARIKRIVPNV